jgi:hypothetical protein
MGNNIYKKKTTKLLVDKEKLNLIYFQRRKGGRRLWVGLSLSKLKSLKKNSKTIIVIRT